MRSTEIGFTVQSIFKRYLSTAVSVWNLVGPRTAIQQLVGPVRRERVAKGKRKEAKRKKISRRPGQLGRWASSELCMDLLRHPRHLFLRRTIILGVSVFVVSLIAGIALMFW